MSKNKKIAIAAVAVAFVIAIFAVIYATTRPATTEGSKTYTVEVVHADETTATFTYQTDEEYLGDALLSEGLVSGSETEYGLYITVVDGEEAIYENDGSYWAFYQNGEYAMVGVSETPVNDGDSFSFVYTIG